MEKLVKKCDECGEHIDISNDCTVIPVMEVTSSHISDARNVYLFSCHNCGRDYSQTMEGKDVELFF
jgi:DNA-directed RNA polymerase subunit RPC12/RpoP